MNARSLTAIRTAYVYLWLKLFEMLDLTWGIVRAASALALSTAPRAQDARVMLIFGAGLQALWHAKLVASLSTKLEKIVIATRSIDERSNSLVKDLKRRFKDTSVAISNCLISEAVRPGAAVEQAGLICW